MKIKVCFIFILFLINPALLQSQSIEKNNQDIENIFQLYFKEILEINPEYASSLGVDESFGLNIRKGQLTDISQEAYDYELELMKNYKLKLESFKTARLTSSQQLAKRILLWHINNSIDGDKFRYHHYLINPMFGVHNNLTTLMTEYHYIVSLEDAENYIQRLQAYDTRFNQVLEGLKIREKIRIYPPKTIINFMINILNEFVNEKPEENILYTSFKQKLGKVKGINKKQKKELSLRAQKQIENVVYPSYQKLISHLEKISTKVNEREGVWKLPKGNKYYKYCLRTHTSTDLTPEEVHQLGLKEVKRIREETIKILLEAGIEDYGSLAIMLDDYWKLAGQKSFSALYYPNNERGKKETIKDFKKYLKKINKKIPDYFTLVPDKKVNVKPVPEFKQISMGAHYSRASLDGRREGVFYVNTISPPFKPGMQTLALHEGIPGHHFQIAIQQESDENRLFRNLVFFTAYVEGWALYAEKLGMENGWFEDEYAKMGYLNSEMLRAVRLVVDTGIHYKKWNRQEAYSYMMENLGWASNGSINRYIVWPGQACAYKVGELKILELREKAKAQLKEKFDIKEFHKVILQHGSVPLSILDNLVDDYINKQIH